MKFIEIKQTIDAIEESLKDAATPQAKHDLLEDVKLLAPKLVTGFKLTLLLIGINLLESTIHLPVPPPTV